MTGTGLPPVPFQSIASASSVDAEGARLASSVENWKRKLLDLSKRNRALNFRMNKVSTIAVVDEQPAEVFRQLYLRERAMRFKAAPERNGAKDETERLDRDAIEDAAAAGVEEEELGPATDFAPYDVASLDERHTDDWLQTASTPDALDRSLRRLDEQAKLSVEEQGVNTLFLALGMLHYTEATDSEVVFRAPLILLPVELSRQTARAGFTIRVGDDEPLVNPALAEYLRQFGIELPSIPDPSVISEDYDLQSLLGQVARAVKDRTRWTVTTEIYLGLFSFQKFVMYKDLEMNASALRAHRLVKQLVTRRGESDLVAGLPNEIARMELDSEFPPENTFQVVDADSSQLRTIAAVSRNYDLVIEGPPGTGKSQTITNLIAAALSAGKSVLFVAEKMAALSVVHDRLQRAKLGEFCLELHSTKTNKRAVMQELAATLDASLQGVAAQTSSTQRLPQVRATLSDYVRAVHEPFGSLGISPYRAYGELGRVLNAPRVEYRGPIDGVVTGQHVEQTVRDLNDLAAAASDIGVPAQHPWRDAQKTFYSEDTLIAIREMAEELSRRLADVLSRAAAIREQIAVPPVETFVDVDVATTIAEVLARSPGAPLDVLGSVAWNQPPAEAIQLVERGRAQQALRDRIRAHFVDDILDQEHAGDVAFVEQKAQGAFAFLAFLNGRYRAIKKRWTSYRKPAYQASLIEQASEMKYVDRYLAERQKLAEMDQRAQSLFGPLWLGERSDWDALERYVKWVVDFRGICVRHGLAGRALEVAATAAPDVSAVAAVAERATEARELLTRLSATVGWPEKYLTDAPLVDIAERTRALVGETYRGPAWAAFEAARQEASSSLAGELLPLGMDGRLSIELLAPAFLRAFYMKWLSNVIQSRPALARFSTLTHEQRVREFQDLDQRVLLENRAALIGQLRGRAQHVLRQPNVSEQMPFLRGQMARQRAHAPLRRTLQQSAKAVRAIKPCFMMSPLTVAQLLPGGLPDFDLVIFDEASQLPAEDAVGSVMRGKQLVVVGDPKQLPPTNFFAVSIGSTTVTLDVDGLPQIDDAESILEEYMGAGVPMSRLKWHYRSAHESLIAFSNVQFYEKDLYTFPSVETGNDTFGLQFEYLHEGVYEGKGLNAVEARRVADEVVRFAKEQLERRAIGERQQSLGVGTFNLRQQLAILDELEQRRRDDPSIEPFFDRGADEPFFVKNLENIQGDERDVIFISVTYAKSTDGRLRLNFGPLNGENGWRRLNVLTTRARERMRVFSSMRGDEINAAATTSRGAHLLREFLLFAERGKLDSVSASLAADTESPFEREVVAELSARGVKAVPQVGVAGYRIDIGILDDEVPGRFVCGIECDGVAYHASETARDRDRLRQQVLEARGWTIVRVWSTDWFKDRQGQIDRLMRRIEEARERGREEARVARDAREQAALEAARLAAEEELHADLNAKAMAATGAEGAYTRPVPPDYAMAPGEGRYSGADILEAPLNQIVSAVVSVVKHESPIHETEILARTAGMWAVRLGARIQGRIREGINGALKDGQMRRKGTFFWNSSDNCLVRCRAGLRMTADKIPPEEYQAAIMLVLAGGHGFARPQLTTEVRTLLGFARTGAALDEAITSAVDALLAAGLVGEGSTGIRRRLVVES